MPDATQELISMRGISKSFPGVQALEDVSFSVAAGEIHALVGENGAGKSTLIKILTGVDHADKGTIEINGRALVVRSPVHAQELGISTVYQEINLCPNLTVAENLLIGRQPSRFRLSVNWKALNAQARRSMKDLDVDIDVTQPLGSYSIAVQQMAAIARALTVANAKVLILDEPTSSLTAHETEQLFKVMRKLRADGLAMVFITHFLDQVYAVSDPSQCSAMAAEWAPTHELGVPAGVDQADARAEASAISTRWLPTRWRVATPYPRSRFWRRRSSACRARSSHSI